MKNKTISVALIVRDEESNIEDCLDEVKWADEIVIVDSGSIDQTMVKARKYTDKIYSIPFVNFSEQKNNVLARCSGDWIFLIDADERVGKALADEIRSVVQANAQEDAVYAVKRLTWFFRRRLRFSGTQEDAPIRLFPRGKVRYEQPVHEEIKTDLPVRCLEHAMDHYSTPDLAHYKRKLKLYVALEIEFFKKSGRKVRFYDFLLRPPAKFIYLYFLKLGILDGRAGFLYALLSSYYDFLKFWGALKKQIMDGRTDDGR
jgi:glycosyltransferase involved in cell wall biosynthesis